VHIVSFSELCQRQCCTSPGQGGISEISGARPFAKLRRSSTNCNAPQLPPRSACGMKIGWLCGIAMVRTVMSLWIHGLDRICLSSTVDDTLSFLSVSAQSRGLPHQVTHNLAMIGHLHGFWMKRQMQRYTKKWDPSKATVKAVIPPPRNAKQKQQQRLNDQSLGCLEEVVRMAEGTSGITMGRLHRPRRTA